MNRFVTRMLFAASLGLSVTMSSASVAQAQHGKWQQPIYQPCPPVIVPYAPAPKHPGDLPGATPTDPSTAPTSPTAPTAPTAPATVADPGAGGGSGVDMLGRGDQNMRFNLFDHMSAQPRTRAWFGFQHLDGYNSGLALNPAFIAFGSSNLFSVSDLLDELASAGISSDVLRRQNTQLYRAGLEVAFSENCSGAVQWQYFTVDGETTDDGFNDPQFLLKYVLHRSCTGCIVSATLGITPETESDPFEFTDRSTRIYPGALFFKDCGDWMVQGGIQFGVPIDGDEIRTFDWALSLGYWLYRAPGHCDAPYGMGCGGCGGCYGPHKGGILGIIPQFELLGKHVLGDATIVAPFGSSSSFLLPGVPTPSPAPFIFNEPREVIDFTAGVTVLCASGVSISSAVSFPVTNDEVREVEFLIYFNYGF
jgi:hypothetical protein